MQGEKFSGVEPYNHFAGSGECKVFWTALEGTKKQKGSFWKEQKKIILHVEFRRFQGASIYEGSVGGSRASFFLTW